MALDTSVPRSRRALLAGGLGGLAVVVANALGRPVPVWAADDGSAILIGGIYPDVQSQTRLENKASNETVLYVASNADLGFGVGEAIQAFSASGVGVRGMCDSGIGVAGNSATGNALAGMSESGTGLFASSTSGIGVTAASASSYGLIATSDATTRSAMFAQSNGNSTGIHGMSGVGDTSIRPKTGVFGEARQDSGSRGVWGYSPAGQGVRGESTIGRGVHGQATSGLGVRGFATSGVGLSGEAETGYALRTNGRVRLDKSAGQATVASGTASVSVNPGIDLTSASAVVATLNGDAGASTTVKRVAIDTAANTVTIYLTANAAASVKVAWLVLG
jgi:hypothetical protein